MSGKGYEWDLTDIDPQEVSLVDKAANKRKFVLIKNEEGGSMKPKTGLEKQEGKDQEISPSVLKSVIEMTQSVIEKLVSLASSLEGMQKSSDGTGDQAKAEGETLPEDIAKEFKDVIKILEGILEKYPSATQKSEKEKADDKSGTEVLEKTFAELSKKLGDLKSSVDSIEKKNADAKSAAEKAGELKKDEGKKDEVNVEKVMTDVKKALEDRATELVKMFQEAATEEFAGVFKDVAEIKKALGGDGGDPGKKGDEKPSADKPRTFGIDEEEKEISSEDNPFHSVFNSVKDF